MSFCGKNPFKLSFIVRLSRNTPNCSLHYFIMNVALRSSLRSSPSFQIHTSAQEPRRFPPSHRFPLNGSQFHYKVKKVSNKCQTPSPAIFSCLTLLPPPPLYSCHCGPQTQVVHKCCPVELLLIMSLCALSRFSHSPGVSRRSITAPAVEGAKTFLSLMHGLFRFARETLFRLHRLSRQASVRLFSPGFEMGLLFPIVG